MVLNEQRRSLVTRTWILESAQEIHRTLKIFRVKGQNSLRRFRGKTHLLLDVLSRLESGTLVCVEKCFMRIHLNWT